jgi:hypothetical protein
MSDFKEIWKWFVDDLQTWLMILWKLGFRTVQSVLFLDTNLGLKTRFSLVKQLRIC